MEYELEINGLKRQLQLCPINEDLYIAGFIMFGDVELTMSVGKSLLELAPDFDVIVTGESKGIPLAYEMSRQSGKNYIVARKGPKLYMQDIVKVKVNSITTDHEQVLCLGKNDIAQIKGKKVLIVDDVISTGETLQALENLVEQIGGIISCKMAVLAEGDAALRDDIVFLKKLPLFKADGTEIN